MAQAMGHTGFIATSLHASTTKHPYSIMCGPFTAVKALSAQGGHPSSRSQPRTTTGVFTVSTVLPFPEWHLVKTRKRLTFSGWPLSLRNTNLLHFFSVMGTVQMYRIPSVHLPPEGDLGCFQGQELHINPL